MGQLFADGVDAVRNTLSVPPSQQSDAQVASTPYVVRSMADRVDRLLRSEALRLSLREQQNRNAEDAHNELLNVAQETTNTTNNVSVVGVWSKPQVPSLQRATQMQPVEHYLFRNPQTCAPRKRTCTSGRSVYNPRTDQCVVVSDYVVHLSDELGVMHDPRFEQLNRTSYFGGKDALQPSTMARQF